MYSSRIPTLVGISGVSGSGKTTLITALEELFPHSRVRTYTTRAMRYGEDPDAYHFVSVETLLNLPDKLWVQQNYGALYAVTKSAISEPIEATGVAILPTITSHHKKLTNALPQADYLGFHILAPRRRQLLERLRSRGEEESVIEERLEEMMRIDQKAQADPDIITLPATRTEALLDLIIQAVND